MEFSLKGSIFVILLIAVTAGITRYCTPEKIRYQTADQAEKLDSLTTLSHALRVDKQTLQDSLEQTSEAFQEFVARSEDQIAAVSQVNAQLRLRLDSLQSAPQDVNLADLVIPDSAECLDVPTFRDTTLTATASWSGGLIEATARGGIRDGQLFLDQPDVTQKRDIRWDMAVSVADDNSRVGVVVSSADLDSVRMETYTALKPERRFPWIEIAGIAGFLLGALL